MPEAARIGDHHACPKKGHKGGPIDASSPPKVPNGSPNVETNGVAQARALDWLTCTGSSDKDLIVTGSDSVEINGLPAARKTDLSSHGGEIDKGSDDVEIGGNRVRVHFTLKDTTVRLSDGLKAELAEIAKCYNTKTGKDLVMTDGARSAEEQASAMYPHMGDAKWLAPYGPDKPGRPVVAVKKAYDDGKTKGLSDTEIKKNMSDVIAGQDPKISDHMSDAAADIGIAGVDQKALNGCLDKNGTFTHFEHGGNHIHMQKKKP